MSLSSKERIELFQSSLEKISNGNDISNVRNLLRQRYLKAKEKEEEEERKKLENEAKEREKAQKQASNSSVKMGKQLAKVFRFGKPRVQPVERRNHRPVQRQEEELDPLLNDPRVLFENFAFEEIIGGGGEEDGELDYDGMPFFPENDNPMGEDEIEDDSVLSLLRGWWARTTWTRLFFWAMLLLLYAIGQKMANSNGFGAPFLMFALLVFIFCNLRKKSPGELSAYSVFNPDCRPIQSVVGHQQPDNQIVLGFGDL